MSMATLAEIMAARLALIETRLADYRAAEHAILTHSQSYTLAGGTSNRVLTRANLATIQKIIKDLEKEQESLTTGGAIRTQRVVPIV